MYYMLFLITFFIALAAYAMVLHNKIMPLHDLSNMSWYKIDTLLKRRMNLIPHLLEAAKGYMQHEKEVMIALNKLRSHLRHYGSNKINIKGRIETELELSTALDKLLTAAQQYPDLDTKVPFLNAKKMLLSINEELNKVSSEYNEAAQNINKLLKSTPNNFIISLFGVHKLDYFK